MTATFILGGVRSGKSRLAQDMAIRSGLAVTCVATATAGDAEMEARIRAHRARRPAHWHVVEEPVALAKVLTAHAAHGRCLLVDCLTLWLTNLLTAGDEERLQYERSGLLAVLPTLPGHIVLVGNESNMGVIPLGKLSRRYGDEAGSLHQAVAQLCSRVVFTVAGLPHVLKGDPL